MSSKREGSGKRHWMTAEGWKQVGMGVEPVGSDSGEKPREVKVGERWVGRDARRKYMGFVKIDHVNKQKMCRISAVWTNYKLLTG